MASGDIRLILIGHSITTADELIVVHTRGITRCEDDIGVEDDQTLQARPSLLHLVGIVVLELASDKHRLDLRILDDEGHLIWRTRGIEGHTHGTHHEET